METHEAVPALPERGNSHHEQAGRRYDHQYRSNPETIGEWGLSHDNASKYASINAKGIVVGGGTAIAPDRSGSKYDAQGSWRRFKPVLAD